jgi:hypothetical protein
MGQSNRDLGLLIAALLSLIAIYAVTALVARASFSAMLPAAGSESAAAALPHYASSRLPERGRLVRFG